MHKGYKLLLAFIMAGAVLVGCKKKEAVIPQGMKARINNTDFSATTYKASKNYFVRVIASIPPYDDSSFLISGSAGDVAITLTLPLPVSAGTYQLYPNNLNSQCSGNYQQTAFSYDPPTAGTLTITSISQNNIQGRFSFTTYSANSITNGEFNMPIMY